MPSDMDEDDYGDDDFLLDPATEAELRRLETQAQPVTNSNSLPASIGLEGIQHIIGGPSSQSDLQSILQAISSSSISSITTTKDLPNASESLGPPPSQNSSFEDELVLQVTNLLSSPPTNPNTLSIPDIEALPLPDLLHSALTEDHAVEMEGVVSALQAEYEIERDGRSLFERFRKRQFFSVSDLVGPSWCEVQYDYRLRSKPFLKVQDRPATIVSREGKEIAVNKVKAGDHEKIMKKGEVVHKKLEREIHPVEVKVTTTTREDVWGLRFLNMLASLQALLEIGKCRELPVVGFVQGYMVVGVIDELVLEKVEETDKSKAKSKSTNKDPPPSQTRLTSFFTPSSSQSKSQAHPVPTPRTHKLLLSDSKTRTSGTLPKEENAKSGMMQLMCYKEMLDGMLGAGMGREGDEVKEGKKVEGEGEKMDEVDRQKGNEGSGSGNAGSPIVLDVDESAAEQKVVSAEIADSSATSPDNGSSPTADMVTIPSPFSVNSQSPFDSFSWSKLFSHLHLDPNLPLSDGFIAQSRDVILGNGLGEAVEVAKTLNDYVGCWESFTRRLGLGEAGSENNAEKSEDRLALVYRNVGQKHSTRRKMKKRKPAEKKRKPSISAEPIVLSDDDDPEVKDEAAPVPEDLNNLEQQEEARLLALAIAESLKTESCQAGGENGIDDEMQIDKVELEGLQQSLLPPGGDTPQTVQGASFALQGEAAQQRGQGTSSMSLPSAVAPKTGNEASQTGAAGTDMAEPEPDVATKAMEGATTNDAGIQNPASIEARKAAIKSTGKRKRPEDGSIIGSHIFAHDRDRLAEHLAGILNFWMGRREPEGVGIENVNRCAWCEFEEGCEWREMKAQEAVERNKSKMRESKRP